MKEFIGKYNAKGFSFGIICARFNESITKNLLDGAIQAFQQFEVADNNLTVAWVPGAFEIPLIAKEFALSGQFDAILCLGAVIKGATPHFDYVCAQVSSGIAKCSYENEIPILFSVLTTDTIDQAIERSGIKSGNKGYEGAQAAVEMANLMKQLKTASSKGR